MQKKVKRDFKGIWIPKEVWLDPGLVNVEKLFFIEIHSLDNGNGCYASNLHFSNFFGISKGRVSQIISSLEKKGYIKTKHIKKGKQILERRIYISEDVVSFLNRGSKFSKGGYLEKFKESNTCYNNTKTKEIKKEKIPIPKEIKKLSIKLSEILSDHKGVNYASRRVSWNQTLRLMVEKDLKINGCSFDDRIQRIKQALEFYSEHIGDKYVPVIESAGSLRSKFIKLENAMKRDTKKYSQNPLDNLTEHDQMFFDNSPSESKSFISSKKSKNKHKQEK